MKKLFTMTTAEAPWLRDESDGSRVKATSDDEVMAAALANQDAQPITPEEGERMRRVSPVKVLRRRLGLTQLAEKPSDCSE